VLSAARPLSIQAHPDKEQAEEGFRRENTMNIPIDSPLRNYRDSNHKPELICALEPMWIMKGFRSVSCILELAEVLGSVDEELGINILRKESNAEGLKNFLFVLCPWNRIGGKCLFVEYWKASNLSVMTIPPLSG
jgi:mannose-6-phosphate isomerase